MIKLKHILKESPDSVLDTEKPIGLSKLNPELADKAVGKGFADGEKTDDVVDSAKANIPAANLKPAQTEIVPEKVIGVALDMLNKGTIGGDLGAIVSKDGYIMDGHHRWAATYLIDPKAKLRVTVMDLPGGELITALNVITKGKLGIDTGNKGTGDIKKLNTSALKPIIDDFIDSGMQGKFPKTSAEVKAALGKVPGANGDYLKGRDIILKNSNTLPKEIMSNAPRRVDMPVIAPNVIPVVTTLLGKGAVDLKLPYTAGVEKNLRESIRKYIQRLLN